MAKVFSDGPAVLGGGNGERAGDGVEKGVRVGAPTELVTLTLRRETAPTKRVFREPAHRSAGAARVPGTGTTVPPRAGPGLLSPRHLNDHGEGPSMHRTGWIDVHASTFDTAPAVLLVPVDAQQNGT